MRVTLLLTAFMIAFAVPQTPQTISLTVGLVIDHSVQVQPGRYRLASAATDHPAVIIRGDDVTVDLTGVVIEGSDPAADPDTFAGTGISIEGTSRVTIRGGSILAVAGAAALNVKILR